MTPPSHGVEKNQRWLLTGLLVVLVPWILTSLSVLVCLRCHHESFRVLLLNLCELRVGFSSFFWLVFLRLFLLVVVVVVVVFFSYCESLFTMSFGAHLGFMADLIRIRCQTYQKRVFVENPKSFAARNGMFFVGFPAFPNRWNVTTDLSYASSSASSTGLSSVAWPRWNGGSEDLNDPKIRWIPTNSLKKPPRWCFTPPGITVAKMGRKTSMNPKKTRKNKMVTHAWSKSDL